jgi:ABC-2 type transport system ATP-binding protein
MSVPVIEVKKLSKTFTYHKKPEGLAGTIKAVFHREKLTKEAVKDVSFTIDQGEFVGFVGPNGAGKTTTLKMLSGILYPTAGTVRVADFDPSRRQDEFKKKISIVMGQKSMVWLTLPAIETFNLLQKMYEIPENVYRARLKQLAELLDVQELLQVQARKLSLGQRMKCELIAALLHDPMILFLDEPTIGLDVVSQKKIRAFLRQHNNDYGTTIILTSHNMDDVQGLCRRLIIINEGQLGYDGSIERIIAEHSRTKNIRVVFNKSVADERLAGFGQVTRQNPYEAEISVPLEQAQEKIAALVNDFPVKDINIAGVSLEDVITELFSEKRPEAPPAAPAAA